MKNKNYPLRSRKLIVFLYGLAYSAELAIRQPKAFVVLLSRKIYHLLPLSASTKAGMKGWLYRNLPSLFSHTLSYRSWKSRMAGSVPSSALSEKGKLSDYQLRVNQEIATYAEQINVHDLPDISNYWSDKYITPMCKEAGFETMPAFFAQNLLASSIRTGNKSARFVSVGAGNCDLEVKVAKELLQLGCIDFVIECLELNEAMMQRGRELAKQEGVSDHLFFVQADFNTWIPEKTYDAVMASQSLHHVTNLEYLFEQIYSSLHDKGAFAISDMIGRNGHQRWPESLAMVHRFWAELPRNYKYNVLLERHEEQYENWDCSTEGFEGIRAQDILPLLMKKFHCEKFIGFGSAIDIFVDRCFGHNFDPKSQWDMNFIDRVHQADEMGLKSGELTPTHMIAVFVKVPVASPFYSRGITPEASIRVDIQKKKWFA